AALQIHVPSDGDDFAFPIGVAPAHEREAETAAERAGGRFALLNPGGGWPTKLWSVERYGALADELWTHQGLRSLVTYGPGEREAAEAVVRASCAGVAQAVSLSLKGYYALA